VFWVNSLWAPLLIRGAQEEVGIRDFFIWFLSFLEVGAGLVLLFAVELGFLPFESVEAKLVFGPLDGGNFDCFFGW